MHKKTITSTIVVSAVALIIVAFFLFRKSRVQYTNALNAVPLDAFFIIEVNDFPLLSHNLLDENKLWDKLKNIPECKQFNETFAFLDSLYRSEEFIKQLFKDQPLIFSMHKKGRSEIGTIGYISLPYPNMYNKIKEEISKHISTGNIKERKYSQATIHEVKYPVRGGESYTSFSYTMYKGIFILSYSSILLEDAVRQLNLDHSVTDDGNFIKTAKTAGKKASANIYINHQNLPDFVRTFIDPGKKIQGIKHVANWTELDVKIKNDAALFNGLSYANDSFNYFLSTLANQSSHEFNLENIIPSATGGFFALGIKDIESFQKNHKLYLNKSGNISFYKKVNERFKNNYKMTPEKFLNKFFNTEIALVFTNFKNYSLEENTFVVMNTKGQSIAKEALLEIISRHAAKTGTPESDYIKEHQIDRNETFNIYMFPESSFIPALFGEIFNHQSCNHFLFIDNHLVFGSSVKSLASFKYRHTLGKTFNNNIIFKNTGKYLSSQSNFYAYINFAAGKLFLSEFLKDDILNFYNDHYDLLSNAQNCFLQISSEGNEMFYNNLFIKYDDKLRQTANTRWESVLDTNVWNKPAFVKNHHTGENEIFVQDLDNNVYLINPSGRTLWKKQINGKIISDIYQVDYYKNGNLQMLFSTKNHIHLLDRNGNNVERYPVKLRSPATTGISLFDYEKNKNYRIFVSCENKKVYNYNKEGNLLEGWAFDKTETRVMSSVQHFRIDTKDYIVFADKYRIYILNRRGEERVTVNNHFAKSINNPFFLDMEGPNPRLVTTDTNGTVHFIYFNGKGEQVNIHPYSSTHYFKYHDLDADGTKDYIFVDENKLEVFQQNKEEIFDYQFHHPIQTEPFYYVFSERDHRLGVTDKKTGKIYLFMSNGELTENFPCSGVTPFSINKFKDSQNNFNLIVGSSHNFLYNYTL